MKESVKRRVSKLMIFALILSCVGAIITKKDSVIAAEQEVKFESIVGCDSFGQSWDNPWMTWMKATAGLTKDGKLLVWADDESYSSIPDIYNKYGISTKPRLLDAGVKKLINTYDGTFMYINQNDELWGYGGNYFGDLGQGNDKDIFVKTKILDNVKEVDCGGGRSNSTYCALTRNGDLYIWGCNNYYIDEGRNKNIKKPIKVMEKVISASISIRYGGCALAISDGELYKASIGEKRKVNIGFNPGRIKQFIEWGDVGIPSSGVLILTEDGKLIGGLSKGTYSDDYEELSIVYKSTSDDEYTYTWYLLEEKEVARIVCLLGNSVFGYISDKGELFKIILSRPQNTNKRGYYPIKVFGNAKQAPVIIYTEEIEGKEKSRQFVVDSDGKLYVWSNSGPTEKVAGANDEMVYSAVTPTIFSIYWDGSSVSPEEVSPTPSSSATIDPISDNDDTYLSYSNKDFNLTSLKWSPKKLLNSSDVVDEGLAQIGLILSAKCQNDDIIKAKSDVEKDLIKLGLWKVSAEDDGKDNIIHKNYEIDLVGLNPQKWCAAHTIALRKYESKGETYNLITIVSRGTKSIYDFQRNDIFPYGFFISAANTFDTLKTFLASHNIKINDENNRYFITGHSLGGATANILESILLDNGCYANDITCYTYASPYTTWSFDESPHTKGFAMNFVRPNDIVPKTSNSLNNLILSVGEKLVNNSILSVFAQSLKLYEPKSYKAMRFGRDIYLGEMDPKNNKGAQAIKYYTELKKENFSGDGIIQNHICETYMANLLGDIKDGTFGNVKGEMKKNRLVSIYCPVSVSVKDKITGAEVARITDKERIKCDEDKVSVFRIGDEKFVMINDTDRYYIDLTGTDTGEMTCIIQDYKVDNKGNEVINEKRFDDVNLNKGKTMSCDISSNLGMNQIKMYVTNTDNGKPVLEIESDGTEIEIKSGNGYSGSGSGGGSGSGSGGSGGGSGSGGSGASGSSDGSASSTVPSPSPTPSEAPATTPLPTQTGSPTDAPVVTPVDTSDPSPVPAEKGTIMINADGFEIVSNGDGTAKLKSFMDSGATSLTVDKALCHDGYTYTITSIMNNALKDNKAINKLIIGESVKKIGAKAFYGCSKLKTIVVRSTKLTKPTAIGKQCFKKIKKKATFRLMKKNYKKTQNALIKKSGAKKPRFKAMPS